MKKMVVRFPGLLGKSIHVLRGTWLGRWRWCHHHGDGNGDVVKPVNMVMVLLVFEAVVGKGSATEGQESQREK